MTRSNLIAVVHNSQMYKTFEHTIVAITAGNKTVDIVAIYRPPSSSFPLFMQEFSSLLEMLTALETPSLICDDFNIHIDTENPNSNSFKHFLATWNLQKTC